jgi:hypothetical protein
MSLNYESSNKGNLAASGRVTGSAWNSLATAGGAAAAIAGGLFLIAAFELGVAALSPGAVKGWLALIQHNWLVVIFKLHAGLAGVQSGDLYRLNLLDLALLILIGVAYLGLYAALRKTSQIWSIIAVIMPFLGIVLFVLTKSAGRSAVMGAGLVISIVMSRSAIFNKFIAWMGLLASAFLLLGDVSLSMVNSQFIAALTGIGYVLLIIWLFLIALRLIYFASHPGDTLLRAV